MNRWLERYESGQEIQVWNEMTSLGPLVREAATWEDAVPVVRRTMERARSNVERLLVDLPAAGYVFARSPTQRFLPPDPTITHEMDRLERDIGRLPFAFRCWVEVVGSVDLSGQHRGSDFDLADPLVVHAPMEHIRSEYEAWQQDTVEYGITGPFDLPFAPDYLHKADISGGPPYSLRVPDQAIDAIVLWEPHQTTFVNYLRIAFRWAGLPGWDPASGHTQARKGHAMPTALADVAAELLPL